MNSIPSSDLRNKYAIVSKQCIENKEPVLLTINGRGDTVLMSHQGYAELIRHNEALAVPAGNFIPSSDLRNKYAEISARCKSTNQPIALTVNGRGSTVVLSVPLYEELRQRLYENAGTRQFSSL